MYPHVSTGQIFCQQWHFNATWNWIYQLQYYISVLPLICINQRVDTWVKLTLTNAKMHARTHTHTACSMLGKLRKKEKKLPPHSYKLGQINNCDWNRQDETWQNCTVLYYSVYCCSFTVLSHTALMPGKALMMILFTGQRDKPIREIWLFPAWMNKRGRGREGGSWRYPRACDLTLSGLMVELILRLNSYVTRLTWPDS